MSRSMQMTAAWHGLMAQTICNLIFTEKSWTPLFFLSELWSRAHQAVKCCIWYINSVLAVSMSSSSGIAQLVPRFLLHGLRLSRRCKEAPFEQSWCFMGSKLLYLHKGWKQGKKVEWVAWKIWLSFMASDLPLCSHYTMFQHITGEPPVTVWGHPLGSSIRAGQITSVLNFWTTAFWARLQRNTDHS